MLQGLDTLTPKSWGSVEGIHKPPAVPSAFLVTSHCFIRAGEQYASGLKTVNNF
jgi:hypothetical protein